MKMGLCMHCNKKKEKGAMEENGFQKAIRQDESIRVFAATHGIFLEGHETRNQKSISGIRPRS